jgi:dimeric dUTPase (all-alpha-NTP-PPase superfamily)
MDDPVQADMLRSIFALQSDLNDYVFRVNECRDSDRNVLTMATIQRDAQQGHLKVNDLPNQWLGKYATAIEAELNELRADLAWKWWSKDSIDLQNIRVELVDILHFLVSAMICAGLGPEKVHDIYVQKHAVNLSRQDAGYSAKTKTEDDNRAIT